MNAAIPSARKSTLPHTDAAASIRDWTEALANGSCDSTQFMRHLRELGRVNAEPIWEALALLDQAFRSRRIDRETFLPIKSNLQQFALRGSGEPAPPPGSTIPKLSPVEPPSAAARPTMREAAASVEATTTAAPPAASPAPIRVGSVLRGRYRIIGVLGKGPMGSVVEAIDEMRADAPDGLQRVAIRILDSETFQESGRVSAYLRHVCRLQTLSHPNLLRVFDFDLDQGRPFLTMELLAGSSLPRYLAPAASALRFQLDRRHVLRCIAGALQCAHAQGIAHGQLRAEEVFITLNGDVRLMGLDGAFDATPDDISKDHLAFAWLARDLLGGGANPEHMRRPEGLTDGQWRALEAVILGDRSEGARLLQQFAESTRTAADEIYTVSYTPPPGESGATGRPGHARRWVWVLLALGVVGGAVYLADDRLDLKSYITAAASVLRSPPAPHDEAVASTSRAHAAAPAVASQKKPDAVNASPTRDAGTHPATSVEPAPPPAAASVPVEAPVPRYSTINFARETLQVEDSSTVARVRVVRQGNISRSAAFVWWTESGSAEPGADFYAVTPRGANFPANSASVDLFVPLVPNTKHSAPVTFYVKIDEPGPGTTLGSHTLAQVSIVPAGYVSPP